MPLTPLQWSAFEYRHESKAADWYWAVGIISISAAAASIIFGNIILAIFILLSAISLCVYAMKGPALLSCEINEHGIAVNNTLYPYSKIESFSVDISRNPKIHLKTKKIILPQVVVPIDEVDPRAVRDSLANYLKEEEHEEPLSQRLMEYLGF